MGSKGEAWTNPEVLDDLLNSHQMPELIELPDVVFELPNIDLEEIDRLLESMAPALEETYRQLEESHPKIMEEIDKLLAQMPESPELPAVKFELPEINPEALDRLLDYRAEKE